MVYQWVQEVRETQGALIDFPIVADLDRRVANLYGMLHPNHDESFTVRFTDAHQVITPAPLAGGRRSDHSTGRLR
jgi:alkyl hydroperoxide reductase subunit AhpC